MTKKKTANRPASSKSGTTPSKASAVSTSGDIWKTDEGAGFNFTIAGNPESIKLSILNHLKFSLARDTNTATPRDWWLATSMAIRDRILERFMTTMGAQTGNNVKRVYYLSLEYLLGRMFENNLVNTGLYDATEEAMRLISEDTGKPLSLRSLADAEEDPGLGNGGLGRLAACFLDSLATLQYPAVGYGIRYEYGLFRQSFVNGEQHEKPDNWLKFGNVWEVMRPEYAVTVKFFGRVEMDFDDCGNPHPQWVDTQEIQGVPYDIPICGYGAKTVNFLRLWQSKSTQEFDLDVFNQGGYTEAVQSEATAETISKVLYPNDSSESGKQLRLMQQYFFVSCSLQDILRRFFKRNEQFSELPAKAAIQLNDTHPAVAVPELMRLLVDIYGLGWDEAWVITRKTLAYTNHTLLPEALEKWSVPLFAKVLPRHLEIIFEINRRFLEDEVEKKWPGNDAMKARLSIIEESNPKMVRMAFLSVVGSHATNGVAALHTELLKTRLFPEFDELYPGKFQNKTNGITPRRFLKLCNPELSELIYESIGRGWPVDLDRLRDLEKFADDAAFQERYMTVKRDNKVRLAKIIKDLCDTTVDPDALFDVQIKRLHEYKRQHLNLLHILTLYRRLLQNPDLDITPRVFIFGAKAAPGYFLAKRIIHAINAVAAKVNADPRIQDKLKVVFLPNYRVTLAESIIPAADLSEQISTAGKEASGTGNMKFALNGALTIGTLDGANVEIKDAVGDDNIFIFGLKVEEVEAMRAGGYNPFDLFYQDEEMRAVVDWLGSNYFTPHAGEVLRPVRDSLLQGGDPFFVLADYRAYIDKQIEAGECFKDRARWARMAILNTARVGFFSSDRTINQYAREIWNIEPLEVPA
jgi:glycogen phosphorylase